MSRVTATIEVDVPTSVAYNQWTQFEEFPQFMEGVEEVQQLDDQTLRWRVEVAGAEREFVTDIISQQPDVRVAWASREGEDHAGSVVFQAIGPDSTRIEVEMEWEPSAWTDKVADALNVIDRRVKGDLKRFKEMIEERGGASGAWRGEIVGGERVDDQVISDPDDAPPLGKEALEEDPVVDADPRTYADEFAEEQHEVPEPEPMTDPDDHRGQPRRP